MTGDESCKLSCLSNAHDPEVLASKRNPACLKEGATVKTLIEEREITEKNPAAYHIADTVIQWAILVRQVPSA